MAKPIEEWLDTTVARYQEEPISKMSNLYFFRDPPRPHKIDYNYFFSPADGIILYQTIVEDDGVMLEVKGEKYTLEDLVQIPDTVEYPSLVIGIFMTFFDVHVNRVPYSGCLTYELAEPIHSRNLPMLLVEKGILEGKPDLTALQYLKTNERMINTFYNRRLDYDYHVVQIADEDVAVITPFELDQNEFFSQNERFSFIRWGSQLDLILPLDNRFKFDLVQKVTNHVEAGVDPLVRITPKKSMVI